MRRSPNYRRRLTSPTLAAAVLLWIVGGSDEAFSQTAAGTPAPASTPPAQPKSTSNSASPSQNPSQDDGDDGADARVTVTARKPRPQPGAVVGDIKPELQLAPADIQSYGVSTVTELLTELAPETRSDRGRGGETPVVLLNGRRISSFNEIQNIPTEAILRVDILPEEVSLKYGYTADQRVVNIVLRRRFRAITGELVGGAPTEGGQESGQGEADLLHLRGDSRLNLDVKYQASSNLTDADRGVVATPRGADYDLVGNVVSTVRGAQIDPNLSGLVGQPVTIAGVPRNSGGALALQDFVPTANLPNSTDVGGDRTLSPQTKQVTANGVWAQPVFLGLNATLNGTLTASSSQSLQGLPGISLTTSAADPFSPFSQPVLVERYVAGQAALRQTTDTWTAHLGSTLNRDLGDWRLSLTDAYDHSDTLTQTGAGVDPAPFQSLLDVLSPNFDPFADLSPGLTRLLPNTTARTITDAANIQFLANGPVATTPAGPLYASIKFGDTESLLGSRSDREMILQRVDLSRNDVNAQLNVDLPVASRTDHVLSALGELSFNVNAAVDDLSDFGVLQTLGYGLNWTPFDGVNLIVSHTNDHAAPTIQQLGGGEVQTPGVRLFDYATGQTVDVTELTGGNPNLRADNRNVFKVGLTLKPLPRETLTITANFIDSHIDNPIETFPAADADIQSAFPDRFVRDVEGVLVEEDDRPVNFASQERKELRWGFNYARPIGPQPPPRSERRAFGSDGQRARRLQGQSPPQADGAGPPAEERSATPQQSSGPDRPAAAPGGSRGRGAGGGGRNFGGGGFGGGPAPGRFQIAVYHTLILQDQFEVRPGGPLLDLLNGAPLGSTGGQPQQEIEAQMALTYKGFGARLSADWKSGTFVRGGTAAPADNLTFSSLGTINLRFFDNLGQQPTVLRRYPWLRGARVTLNIVNLFDQRIEVRDGQGATPLSYQAAYLNPAGRTLSISVRKLFY